MSFYSKATAKTSCLRIGCRSLGIRTGIYSNGDDIIGLIIRHSINKDQKDLGWEYMQAQPYQISSLPINQIRPEDK